MSLLPDDRLDIQCLFQAFANYAQRKQEHDVAYEKYTGYSWGYVGSNYINRMNEAATEAGEYLDKYIAQKVKDILGKVETY